MGAAYKMGDSTNFPVALHRIMDPSVLNCFRRHWSSTDVVARPWDRLYYEVAATQYDLSSSRS